MIDPADDPLADPALAELVATKLLRAADHPWEIERPHDFDGIEAVGRFMELAQRIEAVVAEPCAVEMWPQLRDTTFHAELVLPASAMAREGYAAVRASNFGNLIAIFHDEADLRPDVLRELRKRFDRAGYRFVPSSPLRRTYDGHHRGTRRFATWADRLFGYL
jgi:hypothetical protein